MINLLLGPSGGGKSFEATVFHIMPALRKGRKVITNLPLDLVELGKLDKKYPALVDMRLDAVEAEIEKNTWNPFHRAWDKHKVKTSHRPFASLADYGDLWRHPVAGCGPLYVIDECHKALPVRGTMVDVEEWFAEHRHEFADVLLITQSAGKVSKAIIDNCQVVYRVRKATALGSNNAYIRKVQDGLKGDVVNETIRRYKPEFFKYYKSHTRSDSAGAELAANDIVPFWKRWPMIGAALCLVGVLIMLFRGASFDPMKSAQAVPLSSLKDQQKKNFEDYSPGNVVPAVQVAKAVEPASSVPVTRTLATLAKPEQTHPFANLSIHIISFIASSAKWRYSFSADQNGQPMFYLTQDHLEQSGYTVEKLSECSAKIHYKEISFFAVCDVRSVGMARGLVGNSDVASN